MSKSMKLLLVLLLATQVLVAQNDRETWIVRTDRPAGVEKLVTQLNSNRANFPSSVEFRQIFNSPALFALEIPGNQSPDYVTQISALSGVEWMEKDVDLEYRYAPNDTYLDQQWYLEQISAFDSWNISGGGLTMNGDTIVLAILDDGFYSQHEDLIDNLWINRLEISGDGLDNDENGYVDDFYGVNIKTRTGEHTVREHGTAVAGIAGASGDNDKGVAGVNLHVKLLLISETNSVSRVIEAYQYVLDQRRMYNETNGDKGAYIVATNLSAGVPNVFPDESSIYQEWCAIYDTMGEEGVLSVNSTSNANTNIDVEGDMPGTCSSDYLIIVTNSDSDDEKVAGAGYGVENVDLAAPGVGILTTALSDDYKEFTGTSASAPLVTGAIGLLYSAPCGIFANLTKSEPAAAALAAKEMILDGVDQTAGLSSFVLTGGRLNILTAMAQLRDFCDGTTGDLSIFNAWPNPVSTTVNIHYETENFNQHTLTLSNSIGQKIFSERFFPDYFGDKIYSFRIDELGLSMGVYIVSIRSESGVTSTRLLVIP